MHKIEEYICLRKPRLFGFLKLGFFFKHPVHCAWITSDSLAEVAVEARGGAITFFCMQTEIEEKD